MHFDILIVGGGPAGSILARELSASLKVAIVDKRKMFSEDFSNPRKPCGGLIAPAAQEYLVKMGLGVPTSILSGPQIYAVKTFDFDNDIERYYHKFYTNINRERFDRWLFSLAANRENVTAFDDSIVSEIKQTDSGHDILLHDGRVLSARVVVGADGANSIVRKQLCDFTPKLYIAWQEWFRCEQNQYFHSAIFDRRITDFYSWTIPKDDLILVGTAIPAGEKHIRERFALLKENLKMKGFVFGEKVLRENCYLYRPGSNSDIYLGHDDMFLIGEAAGWISPSSAEGLSYAFRSALALSSCINEYGLGKSVLNTYHNRCSSLFWNLRYKRAKNPIMYNSVLRGLVMKSKVLAL